jgi:hypothetical protein
MMFSLFSAGCAEKEDLSSHPSTINATGICGAANRHCYQA